MQHYVYGDVVKAVAGRLRALRIERGFSQQRFAKEHGWIRSHWALIEKGDKMSFETLVRAANSFDLSVEDLIAGAVRHEGPGIGSKGFKGTDDEHLGGES